MEISDVRRRLRLAIDEAKRRTAERRAHADAARRAYEQMLEAVAVPVFHAVQSALTGEGHRYKVSTPGQAVRLSLERTPEEGVELSLDTERDDPAVVLQTTRGRGRRMLSSERIVAAGDGIAEISDEQLVDAVLGELTPFIER